MRGGGSLRVVVVGAGFAGLTIAAALDDLAAKGDVEVTLIEGAPRFQMGLAAQMAFAGRRGPDEGARPYGLLRPSHVHFVAKEALSIDGASKQVRTATQEVPYDKLVIATGAAYDDGAVPGLAEHAHNLCTVAGAMAMRQRLQSSLGGTVLILVARVPFKCPPAPYEYAMLIHDLLADLGTRDRWKIALATPEPHPMPTAGKAGAEYFAPLLESRGVECHFAVRASRVELETFAQTGGVRRRVAFESGDPIAFDVLGAMFPHRAPAFVVAAGLTDASGFVPVTLGTFQTTDPDVYAVGDVAAIKLPGGGPHPKAGVFAEAQAMNVARSIRQAVTRGGAAPYEGRGTCFIDAGHAGAGAAHMDLLHAGGPKFTASAPTAQGLQDKLNFERERLARWFR